jgi:hypothetical protein
LAAVVMLAFSRLIPLPDRDVVHQSTETITDDLEEKS